ncbi:MAG: hypothetical protein ACKOEC_07950 [Acidimicrobiia bacterium]
MIFDQHEDGYPSSRLPSGPFWLWALLAPLIVFGAVVLTGIAIGAGSAGANAAFAWVIRSVFVLSPSSNLRPESAESGLGNLAFLAVATLISARAGERTSLRRYALIAVSIFFVCGILVEFTLLPFGVRRHFQPEF